MTLVGMALPRGPRSGWALAFASRWAPVAGRIATGLGVVLAISYWWLLTTTDLGQPVDVRAYWGADPAHLYPTGDDWRATGYMYSPAFELVVGWGRLLPLDAFAAIWRALQLATVVYLSGPLAVPVLLLIPVASEVNAGNVQLFLALAIVLGFRWPATWAFVILTKVTPGLGLAWFALRRRWRDLGIALGVTGAIALATALLWPDRWAGFVQLMTGYSTPAGSPWFPSFWDRMPWAIGFVVLGAWRGWRWPVVVGSTLALPVFYTISPSLLVGVLPFLRAAVSRRLGLPAGSVAIPTGQLSQQPVPEPGAILNR